MATSTSCSKIDSLPVNEAPKNKCNSVEFETFANDPVPDSICMTDIVRSDVAIEETNQEPQMENQSKDANVPNPQTCLNINNDEANLTKATSHHPSLMNPNSSARTHEVNVFCNFLYFWLIPFYSKNTSLLQQNIS